MKNIESAQYKVEQDTLNSLYKKLKKNVGLLDFKRQKELKETLYNKCLQQIFVKKDSIKLTYIKRSDYNHNYGGDGATFVANMLTGGFDYGGIDTLHQQYIYYKDIHKLVYNEDMQRLEIYGLIKEKSDKKSEKQGVLMIYNLFDLQYLIDSIMMACNIELKKIGDNA